LALPENHLTKKQPLATENQNETSNMTKKQNLFAAIACAFGVALAAAIPATTAGEGKSCGAKMAGECSTAKVTKVAASEKSAACPMSAKMASDSAEQGGAEVVEAVLKAGSSEKAACSMSKKADMAQAACSMSKKADMAACSMSKKADMAACSMDKSAKMAKACDMSGKEMAGKDCGPCDGGMMALYVSNDGAWYLNSWKIQPEELKEKVAGALEENPEAQFSLEVEEGATDEQVQQLLDFLKEQKIQTVSLRTEDAEPSELKLTQVTGS
jgi:hypothetical protein